VLIRTLTHLTLVLFTVVVLCAGWPVEAAAQSEADKATARALAVEAQQALDAKRYAEAADKFGRAEKLYHAPTLLVGLARAYAGMGKYVEAMESYNAVIRESIGADAPAPFQKAQQDAKDEIQGLDQKIGWVTIRVEGPDAPTVSLDGRDVPVASLGVRRAINPGDHVIEASAAGWQPTEQSFSISSGGSEEVALALTAAPEGTVGPTPTPVTGPVPTEGDTGPGDGDGGGGDTMTILGWTAIGVGGAGLIVGAVTGGLALGKHGELNDNCNDAGQCAPDQQSTLDSYRTMGTISTVGFIAGGVLAAAGTVLLIVAPSDGVEAEVGLGRAAVRVRF